MTSTSVNATSEKLEQLKRDIENCFKEVNVTHSVIEEPEGFNYTGKWCKKIYDGLLCWDHTPAGAYAIQNCPSDYGFNPNRLVRNICTMNGTWAIHPQTNKSWTNYTSCVDLEELSFRQKVNYVNIGGYFISLGLLIIAIGLFWGYNLTNCSRTKVHMHLFISLALNCVSWITYYYVLIQDTNILLANTVYCQLFVLLNMYLMNSSYMWMYCESVHLYISIVVVFVNQSLEMINFVFIGWGFPLVQVVLYALIRIYLGHTDRCMIDYSPAMYVFSIPVVITILCSLYFLIRILIVLISKSRENRTRRQVITSTTRAALILFDSYLFLYSIQLLHFASPLFGLQYLLMPMHPQIGSPEEHVYAVATGIIASLQGGLLAFLFCFTNNEVISQIKTETQRRSRLQREMMELQMTAATAGDSVNIQDTAV